MIIYVKTLIIFYLKFTFFKSSLVLLSLYKYSIEQKRALAWFVGDKKTQTNKY